MIVYHSTPKENMESILKNGLIPQVGPRSELLDEEAVIFFFRTIDDLDNGLLNWFGELFEDEDLVTFEVNLDKPYFEDCAEYEVKSLTHIQPERIKFLRYD